LGVQAQVFTDRGVQFSKFGDHRSSKAPMLSSTDTKTAKTASLQIAITVFEEVAEVCSDGFRLAYSKPSK